MSDNSAVNPQHYTSLGNYSPLHVIEAWELGYHLGNALKYIGRAGRKDDVVQELEKAHWYLSRHLYLMTGNEDYNPIKDET